MISVLHHESFPFRVHHVLDQLAGNYLFPPAQVLEDLKHFIYQSHPCYFTADLAVEAEHGRLQHFLKSPPLLTDGSDRQLIEREAAPPLDLDEPPESVFTI